jgi:hypothetical protein
VERLYERGDEALSCGKFEKCGMLYLYDELPVPEKMAMDDHLDECGECRQEMASAAELKERAASLPILRSPPLSEKVMMSARSPRGTKSIFSLSLGHVFAACAALILIVAGFLLYLDFRPLSTPSTSVGDSGQLAWSDLDETALTDIDGQVRELSSSGDSFYSLNSRIEKRCREEIITQVRTVYAWEDEIGQLNQEINKF